MTELDPMTAETINARRRAHYAAHREEIRARRHAYRADHLEESRARGRAYRAAHPVLHNFGDRITISTLPPELQSLALTINRARRAIRNFGKAPE